MPGQKSCKVRGNRNPLCRLRAYSVKSEEAQLRPAVVTFFTGQLLSLIHITGPFTSPFYRLEMIMKIIRIMTMDEDGYVHDEILNGDEDDYGGGNNYGYGNDDNDEDDR